MSIANTRARRKPHLLIRLWRGEERLWKAWWLIGVAGSWVVHTLIFNVVIFWNLPVLAAITLLFLYAVYAGVAIWRCAFNAERRFWGYSARVLLIAWIAVMIWQIAHPLMTG